MGRLPDRIIPAFCTCRYLAKDKKCDPKCPSLKARELWLEQEKKERMRKIIENGKQKKEGKQ
jgi:hypothetical protein